MNSDLAFPPAVAFKSLSWYHHQATSRESCELCATMGLEAAVAAVMAAFAAAAVAIRSRKKQALQVLWGVVHDPLLAWCLGCGCTCPSHPSRGGTSHPCRGAPPGYGCGIGGRIGCGRWYGYGCGRGCCQGCGDGTTMLTKPPFQARCITREQWP